MTHEIRILEATINTLKSAPPILQAQKAPAVLNQTLDALKRLDERISILESKSTISTKGARNHEPA